MRKIMLFLFLFMLVPALAFGFSVQGQTQINDASMFGIEINASNSSNADENNAHEGRYLLDLHGVGGNLAAMNNYTSETGVSEFGVSHVPSGRGSNVAFTEKASVGFVTEDNCCVGAGGFKVRADGGITSASMSDSMMGLYAIEAQGTGRFSVEAIEREFGEGVLGSNHAKFKIGGNGSFMTKHSLEFGCNGITTEAGPEDITNGILIICPWDDAKQANTNIFREQTNVLQ
jgi:hypothetical protein